MSDKSKAHKLGVDRTEGLSFEDETKLGFPDGTELAPAAEPLAGENLMRALSARQVSMIAIVSSNVFDMNRLRGGAHIVDFRAGWHNW